MSRYWNWTNNLTPGETARAEEVDAQFSEINVAFGKLELEINRSFRVGAAANSSPALGATDLEAAESATQRANKVLACDAAGKPTFVNAAFNYRGAWVSGAVYASNDIVFTGVEKSLYVCGLGHTASAAFATDLATKWRVLVDLSELRKAIRTFQIIDASRSPYIATGGDDLMVDVTGGPVTISLPLAPSINDQPISITHVNGPIGVNNILVSRNGQLIMGLPENMAVTDSNAALELAFANPVLGWRLVRGT